MTPEAEGAKHNLKMIAQIIKSSAPKNAAKEVIYIICLGMGMGV